MFLLFCFGLFLLLSGILTLKREEITTTGEGQTYTIKSSRRVALAVGWLSVALGSSCMCAAIIVLVLDPKLF